MFIIPNVLQIYDYSNYLYKNKKFLFIKYYKSLRTKSLYKKDLSQNLYIYNYFYYKYLFKRLKNK